jgi:hypothetical protein
MARQDEIQHEVDSCLSTAGMRKQSGSWYRQSDDAIAVVNLQKSQYGPSYYLNVAFWLLALGEAKFPKEHECHVRMRLDDLIPDRVAVIEELLDLRRDIADRSERLRELLRSELLPVLDKGSSLDGLRTMRREGRLASAAVRGPALALLDPFFTSTPT